MTNATRTAWLTAVLCVVVLTCFSQKSDQGEVLLQTAIHKELVEGKLEDAVQIYKKVVAGYASNRPVAAKALVQMGQCYEKLGDAQAREARKAYERVLREFADQPESSKVARERLSALTAGGGGATGRTEVAMRRIWAAGRDAPVGISPDGRYVAFRAPASVVSKN